MTHPDPAYRSGGSTNRTHRSSQHYTIRESLFPVLLISSIMATIYLVNDFNFFKYNSLDRGEFVPVGLTTKVFYDPSPLAGTVSAMSLTGSMGENANVSMMKDIWMASPTNNSANLRLDEISRVDHSHIGELERSRLLKLWSITAVKTTPFYLPSKLHNSSANSSLSNKISGSTKRQESITVKAILAVVHNTTTYSTTMTNSCVRDLPSDRYTSMKIDEIVFQGFLNQAMGPIVPLSGARAGCPLPDVVLLGWALFYRIRSFCFC